MDIRAVVIIGLLAALAGIVLYLPFFFFARRKLRPPARESWLTLRVTKAGVFFYGFMVLILFAGFAQSHLAPDTAFGKYMGDGFGRAVFAVALTAIWALLERPLRKRGWEFYRRVG